MRTNLEDVRAHRLRAFATKRPSIDFTLTGTFDIPREGPEIYMLDGGVSTKAVRLPPLLDEYSIFIANIGATNSIEVYNSANILQTTLHTGDVKYFFAGPQRWVWLSGNLSDAAATDWIPGELRVVTAAGAQVVGATEPGLVFNKAIASATVVTLPAIAARGGRPVRFVDWLGTVDIANPVTVNPNGAEKINNAASWEFSNLSSGGVILYPHTTLNGWTVGA